MQSPRLTRFLLVITLLFVALLGAAAQAAKEKENELRQRENVLIADYHNAVRGKDWAHAISIAKQLIDMDASWQNLQALADAQSPSGAYEDAVATYDLALRMAKTELLSEDDLITKRNAMVSRMYMDKGNALLKLHRDKEAVASYNEATAYTTHQALAYFNICAVLYNNGDMTGSAEACRKSLEDDPSRATAYFILGSALFADSKPDKNGKLIIPTEAISAMKKYLELAPNGPHATEVKQMLDMAK